MYKLYYLVILILFISCEKDEAESTKTVIDTEAPVLSLSSPVQNNSQYSGSNLLIEGLCFDNKSLKIFKYSLTDNIGNSFPFSVNGSFNISGSSTSLSENISLPDNLFIGQYNLSCNCEDEAGNISNSIERSFEVIDTIKPKLSVVNGAEIAKGETLSIEMTPTTDGRSQTIYLYFGTTLLATISDNNDIQSLVLFVTSYGNGLNSKQIIFDGNSVSETFSIPDVNDEGYNGMSGGVDITVKDKSNNKVQSDYLTLNTFIKIPQ